MLKQERFELRLDQATIDRLDGWRRQQDEAVSRAEAVRRLVDVGLEVTSGKPITFSDGEKLLLLMMSDVYKKLKIDTGFDPDFLDKVISGGHLWAINWHYNDIISSDIDSEVIVNEVSSILSMWSLIEVTLAELSADDQDKFAIQSAQFGLRPKFPGFDGNNEGKHHRVAKLMVDDLGRFDTFTGRSLNSHTPMIDSYRKMLSLFKTLRHNKVGWRPSVDQIIQLLQAQIGR